MDAIMSWITKVSAASEELRSRLCTRKEFEDCVRRLLDEPDSPLVGLTYDIERHGQFKPVQVGIAMDNDPSDIQTVSLDDAFGTIVRIHLWKKSSWRGDRERGASNADDRIIALFNAFWRPDLRDEKSQLVSFQYPATKALANRAIAKILDSGELACVFFCDLDHFKQVNDTLGEQTGDRVILEFGALLDRTTISAAIPLHRSGDEFIVIHPVSAADEAAALAGEVMLAAEAHDFHTRSVHVGATIGIAVITHEDEISQYDDAEARAEKAAKPTAGVKNRGKVRLLSAATVEPTLPDNKNLRELAACIVKASLDTPRPFSNVWLNLISCHIHDLLQNQHRSYTEVQSEVDSLLLRRLQLEISEAAIRSSIAAEYGIDCSATVAPFDVASAVAHAVFRAGIRDSDYPTDSSSLSILVSDGFCELQLQPEKVILFKWGDPKLLESDESKLISLELGAFAKADINEVGILPPMHRALLVKIGHGRRTVPSVLFADTIVVDDRPARGGGLPDFWEAAIARVVTQIDRNPNINRLYVVGDPTYGKQTIAKLTHLEEWKEHPEQLAHRTAVLPHSIGKVADQLLGGVVVASSDEQVVSNLLDCLRMPVTYHNANVAPNISSRKRFLRRDLQLQEMALGAEDGCRVSTISEAFPVVLEIVRKASSEALVWDAAENELKELIDFKVHLTQPRQDTVPYFYSNEVESLNGYFEREFIGENGLFGRNFLQNGQLEAVLSHLTETIRSARHFATRRAILVIPHEVQAGTELSPLGLVSLRIVPRFSEARIRLHYSYTWRTVEALIGFPYSLYGSMRYAEHLTDRVKERLPPEWASRIDMGELSYIAHSMHILMDDYGESIARRIVDEASK